MSTAMMAMTTSSSIRVKPRRFVVDALAGPLGDDPPILPAVSTNCSESQGGIDWRTVIFDQASPTGPRSTEMIRLRFPRTRANPLTPSSTLAEIMFMAIGACPSAQTMSRDSTSVTTGKRPRLAIKARPTPMSNDVRPDDPSGSSIRSSVQLPDLLVRQEVVEVSVDQRIGAVRRRGDRRGPATTGCIRRDNRGCGHLAVGPRRTPARVAPRLPGRRRVARGRPTWLRVIPMVQATKPSKLAWTRRVSSPSRFSISAGSPRILSADAVWRRRGSGKVSDDGRRGRAGGRAPARRKPWRTT